MPANSSAYIQHHLVHWQWSPTGDIKSFWTLNLDTILISIICGLFFLISFRLCAKRAVVKNPGRFQIFVEMVVEMVDDMVVSACGKRNATTSALALSIFMWIWVMNAMDLLPVDLLPVIASKLGVNYFRAVPTADLSMTFALSFGTLFMIIFSALKEHGLAKYLWKVLSHPFSIYFFPVNATLHIIEDLAKALSLSLRLFGNMFAGELIFFLIALTPLPLQLPLGWFWLGLHLFVITLQAFIFMVLTVVYIGIASDSH